MSYGLPDMLHSDGIAKRQQIQFGGYNHNYSAQDGEIWDMENMSSDQYPLLSPRKPRYQLRKLENPNGLYASDALYWVDGTEVYRDGVKIGDVADGKKQWVSIGDLLIILPDKVYYNTATGAFGSLEAKWEGAVTIRDGTFAGVAAVANTIHAEGADWGSCFRVGDAVAITGCQIHAENNKTLIIREIEGDELRFYENVFVIAEGGDQEQVTISREMPDLELVCEHENRLWGCVGNTIFSCKQNDPFNWNVYDGLTDDSYYVPVTSPGPFTGCCSYRGYVYFFKEDNIYRIYGDRPSNFQAMDSASLGVARGSEGSIAVAGETMFYMARTGIVAYTGGVPQSIAAPFGTERYANAVAGSDGTKYYVSMEDVYGKHQLFVYDTRNGLWHREDETQAVGFGWKDGLYCLDAAGKLWVGGDARIIPEEAVPEFGPFSWAEFGDFVEGDPNRKGVSKLQLRMELGEGAMVDILIQFDSDGIWRKVKTLTAYKKRSYYLPIVPRRCDHFRIKIYAQGHWKLYSMVRESYSGSEL